MARDTAPTSNVFDIKSNHFYCHITTAQVPWWVKFLRACSRQCKKTEKPVHGEARELDGWVWNHSRHPGFCEANNTAVPCFSLVWDARPQFTEFVIQWLNVSQQNCWERRSESTASQSDENAGSFSSFSASAAFPWLHDPDKGLRCRVCEQSTGIQELKVRFALRDGGTNVQKRVSIVDSYTNNI